MLLSNRVVNKVENPVCAEVVPSIAPSDLQTPCRNVLMGFTNPITAMGVAHIAGQSPLLTNKHKLINRKKENNSLS